MLNAKSTFQKLAQIGTVTLDTLRNKHLSPAGIKQLRTFSSQEARTFIGCKKSSLNTAEELGKLRSPPIVVPEGKKMPVKQYTLQLINEARVYFNTLPAKPDGADSAIIVIANFKGGNAKTTNSVNLGQYLALQGYRILIVDADNQGSTTNCFGYIPDFDIKSDETLNPLLLDKIDNIKKIIRKTYWPNIDLIPANLSLYNAEFKLPVIHTICQIAQTSKELHGLLKKHGFLDEIKDPSFNFYAMLHDKLAEVKNNYDIILLDCPPSIGMLTLNSLYAANAIVVPLVTSPLDVASTVQFFESLEDIFARFPEKNYSFIRLQVSRYSENRTAVFLDELIRHYFGAFVNKAPIPESEAIRYASNKFLTLYELSNYEGNKATIERIITPSNEAYHEILRNIKRFWGQDDFLSVISQEKEINSYG